MDNYGENSICFCRNCDGVIYTAKKNDTLMSIANSYGITINDITNANRYLNIYSLEEGDKICIPVQNRLSRNNTDKDSIDEEYISGRWNMNYSRNGAFEANELEIAEVMEKTEANDNNENNVKLADIMKDDITLEQFVNLLKRFDK